jgi:hypothetical protein
VIRDSSFGLFFLTPLMTILTHPLLNLWSSLVV